MEKIDRLGWAAGFSYAAYGRRIGVRTNQPAVLPRLVPRLPVGWRAADSPLVDALYSLWMGGEATPGLRRFHLAYAGSARLARTLDPEEALDAFESDQHFYLAEAARNRLFVHAGVVGWGDRAILFPGRSLTGKTSLVMALVRAGATYFSDEYAVLDGRGRVHPYPTSLAIREVGLERARRIPAAALGAAVGTGPLPVGLVVVTRFRHGARWRPRPLSPGEAALALLANTVAARRRPRASLATLRRVAAAGAQALGGVRGEAAEAAEAILRWATP